MARVRGDSKGMGRDNQTVSVLITTILKFCFPSCIDLILLYTPCKIVSFFSTDEWLLKKNQYTTLNIKNAATTNGLRVTAAISSPAPALQQVSVILPISPLHVDTVGLWAQWVHY